MKGPPDVDDDRLSGRRIGAANGHLLLGDVVFIDDDVTKLCLTFAVPDDNSRESFAVLAIEVELTGRGCYSLTDAPL
jgi:hypothetical protein